MSQAILRDALVNRELFAKVLLSEIETVIEPLRHLDERARASIVALVGAAQVVTAYERSLDDPDAIGDEFEAFLSSIHEEGARMLGGLRRAGLAESLPYAWTLARCRVAPGARPEASVACAPPASRDPGARP